MPAGPCTGALRRKLPTGHPSEAGPPGHRSISGARCTWSTRVLPAACPTPRGHPAKSSGRVQGSTPLKGVAYGPIYNRAARDRPHSGAGVGAHVPGRVDHRRDARHIHGRFHDGVRVRRTAGPVAREQCQKVLRAPEDRSGWAGHPLRAGFRPLPQTTRSEDLVIGRVLEVSVSASALWAGWWAGPDRTLAPGSHVSIAGWR